MAIERTLSIIKPDATRRNLTGKVNAVIEGAGLRIVAQKRIRLTRVVQNAPGPVIIGQADFRRRHAPCGPVQKPRPQARLQSRDMF